MLCYKCGYDVPQQETSLSVKMTKGFGAFVLWGVKKTITTTLSIPLRIVSGTTQMIIKPILYGGIALAMVHVAVRPDESRQIGMDLLRKSPKAMSAMISYTPTFFGFLQMIAGRLYQIGLRALDKKICDKPAENPTLLAITKSVGQKLYQNVSFPNHNQLVLLCKDQEKIQRLMKIAEDKIKIALPRLKDFLINQINTR